MGVSVRSWAGITRVARSDLEPLEEASQGWLLVWWSGKSLSGGFSLFIDFVIRDIVSFCLDSFSFVSLKIRIQ